jgi:predicted metalloprotease with PDZ domain
MWPPRPIVLPQLSVSATIATVRVSARRYACAGLLAGLCALAAAAADYPQLEPIIYTLSFPERHEHRMHVELEFPRTSGLLRLRMSRSSPGRYALHDFARNVDQVTAVDADGRELSVARSGPAEWHVSAPIQGTADQGGTRVRVRYRVYGERLDGTYLAVDATHAHINIPAALMWAVGQDMNQIRVRIQPPDASWRIATQLFPTADPFQYTAPNLHYLVDSPIEVSAHVLRSFVLEAGDVTKGARPPTVFLAIHHAGSDADVDRFLDGLKRIVREQAALFEEFPAYDTGSYTFIADLLPSAAHDGMEHRNSAVLTGEPIAAGFKRLLGLAAHEFFHGWNVERMRPRSLEPFNLFDVNPSGELWLAEGFTQYYEALTMSRTGLWSVDEALVILSDAVSRLMTAQLSVARSAEEMSRLSGLEDGAPIDPGAGTPVLSHYALGCALALGFDLVLRERSAGERSLDDFMRAMWRQHGRPTASLVGLVQAPYTSRDIEARLSEVGGAALAAELMGRFVRGRETMDYPRLLARAGLLLEPAAPDRASLGAILLRQADGRVRLAAAPPPGSPLGLAGLAQDDAVVRIHGRPIDNVTDVTVAVAARRPGDEVMVEFEPAMGGPLRTVSVRLVTEPGWKIVRVEANGGNLSDREKAFRSAWLAPNHVAAAIGSAPH